MQAMSKNEIVGSDLKPLDGLIDLIADLLAEEFIREKIDKLEENQSDQSEE